MIYDYVSINIYFTHKSPGTIEILKCLLLTISVLATSFFIIIYMTTHVKYINHFYKYLFTNTICIGMVTYKNIREFSENWYKQRRLEVSKLKVNIIVTL